MRLASWQRLMLMGRIKFTSSLLPGFDGLTISRITPVRYLKVCIPHTLFVHGSSPTRALPQKTKTGCQRSHGVLFALKRGGCELHVHCSTGTKRLGPFRHAIPLCLKPGCCMSATKRKSLECLWTQFQCAKRHSSFLLISYLPEKAIALPVHLYRPNSQVRVHGYA